LNDLTAPSVFGTLDVQKAGITGLVQTTGIRIDPINGTHTSVAADFGQLLLNASVNASVNPAVTTVTRIHSAGAISGQIICRGNLVSQVIADNGLTGVISAQGDMGTIQRDVNGIAATTASGGLTRYGGISIHGNDSGKIIALGNIFGDVSISGTMTGRIAGEGRSVAGLDVNRVGILGNVSIHQFASAGAIISGGLMGDSIGTTMISVGSSSGFLAAKGGTNLASSSLIAAAKFLQNLGGSNLSVANAIFTNAGSALLFDTGGSMAGLALIEKDLGNIKDSNGTLSGTIN
jgi:hypothetical protein